MSGSLFFWAFPLALLFVCFVQFLCITSCHTIITFYYYLIEAYLLSNERRKWGESRCEGIWEELRGVEGRETIISIYCM